MNNLWKNDRIRLRQTTESDYGLYIDENGDFDTDTLGKYDYIDFPLSVEILKKRITDNRETKLNKDDFNFTIETHSHEIIGQIVTFDCDEHSGTFKYGVFILKKFQGKGLAADAVKIVLNYYFNELRYNKVNVYVYDYNTSSQKFHEKLGFTYEGRLRQMSYSNGEFHDIIFYGMLKSEFNQSNQK